MRIALAFPDLRTAGPIVSGELFVEHLGLGYLSAVLRNDGHETRVVEQYLYGLSDAEVLRRITEFAPEIVGFSISGSNRAPTLDLAERVRRSTPALVVVGGFYPTILPDVALDPRIDLVVLGEGEETIRDVVRRRAAKEPMTGIPGTAWRESGEIRVGPPRPRIRDLDALPDPDRRGFDPRRTRYAITGPWRGFATVVTSRGCDLRCGFCASQLMWQGHWIGRSPESVVAEIARLKEAFGVRRVQFQDEEPNGDRARALDLYRRMRALRVTFGAGSSVRFTDLEVADAMIDAGLRGLFLGFESGAPAVLGKLAKRFDPEDGLRLTRHLRRRGVFVSGNFILGLPWENGETLRQTRDFARRLNLDLCYFNFHKPEPGTPFHRLSVRKGLLDPARYDSGKYDAYAAPLPTLFLTSREMEKASRRFLAAVYLRPTYWLRIAARVLRRPARVMSYAWFARVFVLSGVRWAIATRRAKAFRAAA